jgi:thioesterase domain-containing protein
MKGRRQLGRVFAEKYRYEALQESWVVAESRYTPGLWGGKAVLFRAREESAISRWTAVEVDEQHGWGRYVKGGIEVVICPGNHETMCEEPYVRTLAQKLREAIDRATASANEAVEPPPVSRDGNRDRYSNRDGYGN